VPRRESLFEIIQHLARAMLSRVLIERTLTRTRTDSRQIAVAKVEGLKRIFDAGGNQNFFSRPKESIESLEPVAHNGSAAGRRFKESA
jgi:hypothetical protein